ncbi:phosphatase PAP2 family protein [Neorhizobium sp. P12A]|uniref:phosphatase PAP2 family protein n=1 Tax=Neorhizobium sp. P12A TaxID=2268027 RepID=UPI0011EF8247|nr:phosphatase PAP2 family protein [Neorhizobium sp. P12A]KAA0697909.1 phosphatase PAP2 family protein [Neorhizobium sp. P12A]
MHEYASASKRALPYSQTLFYFVALFVIWWALLLIFNRAPAIDIAVARYFFSNGICHKAKEIGDTCGVFAYDRNLLFVSLRSITLILPYVAVAVLIAIPLVSWRRLGSRWRTREAEQSIVALTSLALGCGLIVNLFLKEFSGRPRPRDTDLFGGALDFVQAGSFAGKCLQNCSFVSGEASSGGWLLCLVFLLSPRWRLPLGIPLAIISVAMPAMRVMTGAHYLSDAVLGWLLSLVIFAGVLAAFDAFSPAPRRK